MIPSFYLLFGGQCSVTWLLAVGLLAGMMSTINTVKSRADNNYYANVKCDVVIWRKDLTITITAVVPAEGPPLLD